MKEPETNTEDKAIELRRVANAVPAVVPTEEERRFALMQRKANAMAMSMLLPEHLYHEDPKVRAATCVQIVSIADAWRQDPFLLMNHTFVVGGKLAFEGKAIAGVVNQSGKLQSSLNYIYSGTGDQRKVVVSGRLKGEDFDRTVEMTVAQGKAASPRKHQMWTSDPDQKLAYSAVLKWARRHMPEVVTGIVSEDEAAFFAAAETHATRQEKAADVTARLLSDDEPENEPAATIEGEVVEPETPRVYDRGSPEVATVDATEALAMEILLDRGHDEEAIRKSFKKARVGILDYTSVKPAGRDVRAAVLTAMEAGRWDVETGRIVKEGGAA